MTLRQLYQEVLTWPPWGDGWRTLAPVSHFAWIEHLELLTHYPPEQGIYYLANDRIHFLEQNQVAEFTATSCRLPLNMQDRVGSTMAGETVPSEALWCQFCVDRRTAPEELRGYRRKLW